MITNDEFEKEMQNIKESTALPKTPTPFRDRISRFLSPRIKQTHTPAKQCNNGNRTAENQRYYTKHQKEIRQKRKERYGFTGK